MGGRSMALRDLTASDAQVGMCLLITMSSVCGWMRPPSIHPSIHCGILCLSYPVRETDRYTYPETGTHRTKIGTDVYTQKQRCRDIETETERDPQGEEGQRWREKLILLRAGGRWHKQAEFRHDCALTGSRLGPCLQQGTLILTPRGSNVQWLRSTVRN